MANDEAPSGFLSRWSRRKAEVREGRAPEEPAPTPVVDLRANSSVSNSSAAQALHVPAVNAAQSAGPSNETVARPMPSMADAQQLTPESDFTGFMARGVSPDVKNAAMKKLFTDPHFNVMDRMDIYIDDYTQPDPLPMAMLRQMTSAKTLNLFDDEPESAALTNVGDKPLAEPSKVVAQSVPIENNSNIEPTTHDHADLRLQPDPTPGPEGAEPKPV
jgi:hypothetical protein